VAKVISDEHIDGGLTAQVGSTTVTACAGQPTSQADIAVKALASTPLAGGDWTIANGDVSGRKATMGTKAGVSISFSGTADHVAVDDGTGYTVTTCPATALTSGNTVTFNPWDREILDPTP